MHRYDNSGGKTPTELEYWLKNLGFHRISDNVWGAYVDPDATVKTIATPGWNSMTEPQWQLFKKTVKEMLGSPVGDSID